MKSFQFCLRWLYAVCAIIILYGLGLVFFSQSAFFDLLLNNSINSTFWGTTQVSPAIVAFQRFIYSVLGATVAGWGTMMAFAVHYSCRNKEKWVRNAIVWSLLIWFVLDTGYSVFFQAYINAIINTLLLVALGLPLLITRKEFK